MSATAARDNAPQSFISSYAPRIRNYGNSLLTPVTAPATQAAPARTTKRGTAAINYAEDGFDDDAFFEDGEGPRRPTGLRSLRREESGVEKGFVSGQVGKTVTAPVDTLGIWREWMGKTKRSM